MTLHLHTATRTDQLATELAELLATPLDDPFTEEVVVVPAKGVERWLTQRLSHRLGAGSRNGVRGQDGVCAGVRFLNPRSLVGLLTGTDRDDSWDPDRFVWPLLDLVDEALGEPWCRTLATHLGHGVEGEQGELRRERRYSVVRRLAGLFAAYAVQRPQLLTDWREGRDTDGAGGSLAEDLRWQPELWRRLVEAMPADPPEVRHCRTVEAIRSGSPLALPDRLSMFGHTRLPVTELELLRAVAEVRDVHLWLPQPSPTAWRRLADVVAAGPVHRSTDTSRTAVEHPLLASLGRDSRELQRSLALLGPVEHDEATAATGTATGTATGAATAPPSLLGLLQDDLRADRLPAQPNDRVLDPEDRSVQVHACHGATRQVEALREVLVGLLEDDPTLEPRDIVVMCPDVEAYAPLFASVFGFGDGPASAAPAERHPAHSLRVRLADRALATTNPLLALAGELIRLAGGRGTASEVLDLAAAEPVRHRFRFTDDELVTITGWAEQGGVRWGLTRALRAPYRLDDFDQNTWQAGLDRLLLGVAMAEDEGCVLGSCLPLDDVGSAAVDLAGRLAELVERLGGIVTGLRGATSLRGWVEQLRSGVRATGSVGPRDAWQLAQFERELDAILDAGTTAETGGAELRLADVRTLLELRLQPRPTRANFRTGHLTVCTMVPMRSVPHRVVCLVGLDDGVFPRNAVSDGDDVLARDPMTGERDARSEDRQLLLDAVLAAGDTLVVTYTGANEHSGQERPPAVPLGELLDAVERTVPGARERVLVRHPLQPFDVRNFAGGTLGRPEPFSFDRASLAGAAATVGARVPRRPLLTSALPDVSADDVTLEALQSFFANPVRAFLRQRLDVGTPQEYDEIDDALPVEIDSLTAWSVGDRVLRSVVAGGEPQSVLVAEQFRGDLPPLRLGERKLKEITKRASALYHATAEARTLEPRSVDVTVDLGGGRRLTGVVPDVRGDRIVRVNYGGLFAKHRIRSWLDLLALSAGLPDRSWTASTYGWHNKSGPQHSLMGPLDHTAIDVLRELVDVYDRGLREPLPLPVKTAHAWADAVRARRNDPAWSAVRDWESSDSSPVPGEQDDAAHVRVFGRAAPFDVLLGEPGPDERWNDQRSRLGQYAVRIWSPVFAHEQVRQA